jgi:hypothetical protein
MPIILFTQEPEIRKIAVQSHPIVNEIRSQKKKNHKKRAGGVAQGIGPEFKPQYCQKKKNSQHHIIKNHVE